VDLIGLIVGFVGSAAVAVYFNVPRRALIPCGILGDIAWFSQIGLENHGLSLLASNFLAAFLVALLAEALARIQRLPVTCMAVPGVIPLVPGFSAYNAMYGYVTDQLTKANYALLQAILLAGAISAALAIAGSLVAMLPGQHPWRNPQSPIDDTVPKGAPLIHVELAPHGEASMPPRDSG
jgi:uncharacterized membrane protein YjjB (DUF3815 family)